MRHDPGLKPASAASLLLGMDAAQPRPLADSKLGLAEDLAGLSGRVPVLHALSFDERANRLFDAIQPLDHSDQSVVHENTACLT